MKIVIQRKWWMIHRMPMMGLNPLGWIELRSVKPFVGEIMVDGHYKPNDGGGGLFKWDVSR